MGVGFGLRCRPVCIESTAYPKDECTANIGLGSALILKLSAPPLRSLRLCGESLLNEKNHRGDAEDAEVAQRKTKLGHYLRSGKEPQ